ATARLAALFLSLRVDLVLLFARTGRRLAWKTLDPHEPSARRLENRRYIGDRSPSLRLLLGNVELLLVPEVGLSCALFRVPARVRNAPPWIPGVPSLRVRALCRGPSLAVTPSSTFDLSGNPAADMPPPIPARARLPHAPQIT